MAKYYVSSGEIRQVLNAQDAESAALEALSRFLEPHDWIFDSPSLTDTDRRAHLAFEVLTCLDAQMVVSQRGYRSKVSSSRLAPSNLGAGESDSNSAPMNPDPVYLAVADLLDTYFRLQKAISRYASCLLAESCCDFEHDFDSFISQSALLENAVSQNALV